MNPAVETLTEKIEDRQKEQDYFYLKQLNNFQKMALPTESFKNLWNFHIKMLETLVFQSIPEILNVKMVGGGLFQANWK